MGVYDVYGKDRIQLKNGPNGMFTYAEGDKVEIPNGLYSSVDGAVIIEGGKVFRTFLVVNDHYGRPMDKVKWIINIGVKNGKKNTRQAKHSRRSR